MREAERFGDVTWLTWYAFSPPLRATQPPQHQRDRPNTGSFDFLIFSIKLLIWPTVFIFNHFQDPGTWWWYVIFIRGSKNVIPFAAKSILRHPGAATSSDSCISYRSQSEVRRFSAMSICQSISVTRQKRKKQTTYQDPRQYIGTTMESDLCVLWNTNNWHQETDTRGKTNVTNNN